ncbi:MAG: four helix bundle protein [Deltaproteobacteria bacterium]|nr:four helix bundle protein [Deltaproteobacteria bacterium]
MRDLRKLDVWEKAHHFTLQVCKITKKFPLANLFNRSSLSMGQRG